MQQLVEFSRQGRQALAGRRRGLSLEPLDNLAASFPNMWFIKLFQCLAASAGVLGRLAVHIGQEHQHRYSLSVHLDRFQASEKPVRSPTLLVKAAPQRFKTRHPKRRKFLRCLLDTLSHVLYPARHLPVGNSTQSGIHRNPHRLGPLKREKSCRFR